MRRILTLGVATVGLIAAGVALPASAQAAGGSCIEVHVSKPIGKFDGWQCHDDTGTSVGGPLKDTLKDGKCVALKVVYGDGTQISNSACDSARWPTYVGTGSNSQVVVSVDVISVNH